MRVIVYIVFSLLLFSIVDLLFFSDRRICKFTKGQPRTSIATVKYGPFSEYIPQNGTVERDTLAPGNYKVKVTIDELYLSRISEGLNATTSIKDTIYSLAITEVREGVVDGRFVAYMIFKDELPGDISTSESLRLRIELTGPRNAILLPVGGFYKDTGGNWVYVLANEKIAVRRTINLGRKMGSEYFEVLDGLTIGERVITSSYEQFGNVDSLDLLNAAPIEFR